ncbi:MAG: PQQ-binding-like beta-propeller repeat protein [Verrucomicrobiota bacterium]
MLADHVMFRSMRYLSLLLLVAISVTSLSTVSAEENWYQFRGPSGRGHSTSEKVPQKWDKGSVVWKKELPGTGQSSVVNWGDLLFVTSAEDQGRLRYLFCLDRKTGEEIWKKSVQIASPESSHKMNSHATPTCAVDADHVYAFFGPGGMYCFNHNGDEKWHKKLGSFPGSWGVAASPIVYDQVIVQNCDATGPSKLVAMDKKSGRTVWETKRESKPKGGWSTPIMIEHSGKRELVLNGELGVRGYDPRTGKELWFCAGFNGRGSPVPDYAAGLLHVVNGKPGDVYAVKPGGSGTVTETHRVWNKGRKAGRDLPSPAVVNGYLIVVDLQGIGSCFDAKSGDLLWNERLPSRGEFAASPLVANGLVYFVNAYGGETLVLRPGPEMEIVSTNSVGAAGDEVFRSTLSPIKGQMFLRSLSAVYCIK